MFEIEDKDLAVPDAARAGRLRDGAGDGVGLGIVESDLDLELGQEVDGVFGPAIDLGVTLRARIPDFGEVMPCTSSELSA